MAESLARLERPSRSNVFIFENIVYQLLEIKFGDVLQFLFKKGLYVFVTAYTLSKIISVLACQVSS